MLELFAQRAGRASTQFTLDHRNQQTITDICRRLDRLPLAIELAAHRMRTMTPGDLLDRLSWRFRVLHGGAHTTDGRHRSLCAVVDWSYELLEDTAQQAFEVLSVFAGAFTLQAAETVTGAVFLQREAADPGEVAAIVLSLVDRSMVTMNASAGSARYALLETLRGYGRERLDARPDRDRAYRAHAEYYTCLAERAAPGLYGRRHAELAADLDQAFAELRTAHVWALEEDLSLDLRLVGNLALYVECRMTAEVPRWTERTLEAARQSGGTVRSARMGLRRRRCRLAVRR